MGTRAKITTLLLCLLPITACDTGWQQAERSRVLELSHHQLENIAAVERTAKEGVHKRIREQYRDPHSQATFMANLAMLESNFEFIVKDQAKTPHKWSPNTRWVTHIGNISKRRSKELEAVWGKWEHLLFTTLDDGTVWQLETVPEFDLGGEDVILLKHRSLPTGYDYFLVPVDHPETRTAIRYVRADVNLATPPTPTRRRNTRPATMAGSRH